MTRNPLPAVHDILLTPLKDHLGGTDHDRGLEQ